MADPLINGTTRIEALLHLASTIRQYLDDLEDATEACKEIIIEIESTSEILSTLQASTENATVNNEDWSTAIQRFDDPNGPLNLLKTTFQELVAKFEGEASTTGIRKTVKYFRWPFKPNEAEKLLRTVRRQKILLSSVLKNDHVALSQDIRSHTLSFRDDIQVRSTFYPVYIC
jgi:hypothetical protein